MLQSWDKDGGWHNDKTLLGRVGVGHTPLEPGGCESSSGGICCVTLGEALPLWEPQSLASKMRVF